MPSGYTANIYEGRDQSLRDFLSAMSRGMGLYIMQRDEAFSEPPKPREVREHYYTSLNSAKTRLDEVLSMTDEQKQEAFEKYVDKVKADNEKRAEENFNLACRYHDRIQEVRSLDWSLDNAEGEVGEFFRGFHKFVNEQLQDSYDFDVSETPYQVEVPATVEQWYADELTSATSRLAYASKALAEEQERVAKQNIVHRAFMDWLDKID